MSGQNGFPRGRGPRERRRRRRRGAGAAVAKPTTAAGSTAWRRTAVGWRGGEGGARMGGAWGWESRQWSRGGLGDPVVAGRRRPGRRRRELRRWHVSAAGEKGGGGGMLEGHRGRDVTRSPGGEAHRRGRLAVRRTGGREQRERRLWLARVVEEGGKGTGGEERSKEGTGASLIASRGREMAVEEARWRAAWARTGGSGGRAR